MSAYLFIHLVDHLQLSFSWFLLQFMDLCSVFVWLLNQFHLVAIYWLACRDRNSPLCHIRVSLTSCIGAGHIIFFAGIDSTGNQVTLWTYTFVLLIKCCCSCNCLFVFCCLFDCLFVFFFNLVQLLYDLKTDWSIEGFFFLVFCLFVCFHVFYVLVLRYSFCLLWFLSLSVFRIVISANTICQANNYIFTDYLFLAGCLCSCGSSYAVFPDGQFLLDACRGDLYLLICCKGLQHYR